MAKRGPKSAFAGPVLAMAKRLRRRGRSCAEIAAELAKAGHLSPRTGGAFSAEAVRVALLRAEAAR